jgi:hypothetical protein
MKNILIVPTNSSLKPKKPTSLKNLTLPNPLANFAAASVKKFYKIDSNLANL